MYVDNQTVQMIPLVDLKAQFAAHGAELQAAVARVAEKQDYEVRYLAQKYGLDREQARNLIARVGNDREKLDQAARELIGT